MAMYYNGKKVKNLYYNGKCITRLALGKEMTRLVEGDDFVTAEWLKGDGSAYIDTLHDITEDLDFETHVDDLSDRKCLFWMRYGVAQDGRNTMLAKAVEYFPGLRVANNSSEVVINPFISTDVTVSTNSTTITINGSSYQITKGQLGWSKQFRLFYSEFPSTAEPNGIKCSYFRFLDSDGNYILNLIPCRLLHAIPATLDANGIARNAGECGMYDSISGKFYGNVASSGSFTVSDN